jgi:hypothetical protein
MIRCPQCKGRAGATGQTPDGVTTFYACPRCGHAWSVSHAMPDRRRKRPKTGNDDEKKKDSFFPY